MAIKDVVLQGFGASDLNTIFTRGFTAGVNNLVIYGNGVVIAEGAAAATATGTQWPALFLNDGLSYRQFDVKNTATTDRVISSVTLSPTSKFSIIVNPGTITAGETKRLVVALNPDAAATYVSTVSLVVTDYVESNFDIAGTVSSLDPSRNTYGRSTIGPAQ